MPTGSAPYRYRQDHSDDIGDLRPGAQPHGMNPQGDEIEDLLSRLAAGNKSTLSWDHRSPAVWRGIVELQRRRLDDGQASLARCLEAPHGHQPGVPPYQEQVADVYFLLLAVRSLTRCLDVLEAASSDTRLLEAREHFDAFADAKDLRDIFEHYDEYAVGQGRLQRESIPEARRVRSDSPGFWIGYESRYGQAGEMTINFSDSRQVRVKSLADAAVELANVFETIELERAERKG